MKKTNGTPYVKDLSRKDYVAVSYTHLPRPVKINKIQDEEVRT